MLHFKKSPAGQKVPIRHMAGVPSHFPQRHLGAWQVLKARLEERGRGSHHPSLPELAPMWLGAVAAAGARGSAGASDSELAHQAEALQARQCQFRDEFEKLKKSKISSWPEVLEESAQALMLAVGKKHSFLPLLAALCLCDCNPKEAANLLEEKDEFEKQCSLYCRVSRAVCLWCA